MQNYYWFRKYKVGMDSTIKLLKWFVILIFILTFTQILNLLLNTLIYVQFLK